MSKGQQRSLSRRLLLGLVLVSCTYWGAIAWWSVRGSVDEVYELFDAHLVQTALALLRVTDPDENGRNVPLDTTRLASPPGISEVFFHRPPLPMGTGSKQARNPAVPFSLPILTSNTQSTQLEYERHLRYQVWSREGVLLTRSANAPSEASTSSNGFSETVDTDGRIWRHYALWDTHALFRVVVSEDHELRNLLVRSFATRTASPLALGLPVLIMLLWFSIHRGLNPLGLLTREIASRRPDNLVPLDAQNAPQEVRGMVLALNALLQRVGSTLEGERRFTANAAHELRTPLAALQAQLHLARSADTGAERQAAMHQLQLGVERAIRLVGQMLSMARLDPELSLPNPVPVDLGEVAVNVCAALAPLALQRHQKLELDVAEGLPKVMGNADMLSMLVSNLVDNAIRYTPEQGHVNVQVRSCEQPEAQRAILLAVQDNGPGIAPAERERVFERFVRLAGHETDGTGLGLSICSRIAQLHHATVELAEPEHGPGLRVTVCLFSAEP